MPVTDTAARLAGLNTEDLVSLHDRLDRQGPVDAATVEAHHLAAIEMLKRDLQHGHSDDEWVDSVILVEQVQVAGPEEIEAPEGFEKAWGSSLAKGGTVSVLLTTDGYVVKADPTVSDVHVDTIMGGGRKRRKPMVKTIREENGKFTVYSQDGRRKFGTYDTRAEAEERLRQVEGFSKADGYSVPREVQSAAKQALAWIEDGKAGGGFTSVGRGRARQLASGGTVSRETLVKMRAYFARHAVDKKAEGWGDKSDPTPGMVAWYAWGGDAGRSWANRVLGDVEKAYDAETALTMKEQAMYYAYESIAERYGEFTPTEAHYMSASGNPFAGQGMNCANCVFFEGGGGCEILTEQVEAMGLCKLWVIPSDLMRHDRPMEPVQTVRDAVAKFTLPGGAMYEFTVPVEATEAAKAISVEEIAKHQQGKHDQASHGQRAGAGMRVSPEVASSIIERVREQGGLSVNMLDGSEPPDGYMVARTENVKPDVVDAATFFDADAGPKALSGFLRKNKDQLTGGDYLGLWHDTNSGKVFLDVSQNVKDRATAERLGSERDQISIWDVVEGKEIPTGGTGEIAKADPSDRTTGSVADDGRGDRRLRDGDLAEVQPDVVKHGEPGRDTNYHRKHPTGRGGAGGAGATEGKVYRTRDHKRAISMLARGEKVILETESDVHTFLEKMHEFASEAREKGEDAGKLDLCRVSVPGTNLFCTESLGVPRIEMPQLAGKPVEGSRADKMPKDKNGEVNVGELFTERLRGSGVEVTETEVPAASLKASQNELKGANVAFMMSPNGQKAVDLEGTRIFVTSDGYVVDGHHRWAANVGLDTTDGKLGDKKMKVTMIDMPISEVLQVANDFADEIGIAPKAAKSRDSQPGADEATLVSKQVAERMFTLGPMYIPNVKDAHAEWTDPEELQKAVWEYVKKGDRRIRLQHDKDVVAGEWLEIMAWPYEVEAPIIMKDASEGSMKFPANTVFLGVKWEPWAWQMIKEGKLRGYSIGGRAERLLADLPEEYVGKAQAPFEDAIRIEADDVEPPPIVAEGDLEERIAVAVAEAIKSINPVVNVVMPDDKPKVRRVERDENGAILRIVEE